MEQLTQSGLSASQLIQKTDIVYRSGGGGGSSGGRPATACQIMGISSIAGRSGRIMMVDRGDLLGVAATGQERLNEKVGTLV